MKGNVTHGGDMALPAREQAKYWGVAAAVFFFVLWVLGDVLLPFVLGGAIAYLLDPLADRLQRLGLSRVMATLVIAILIFVTTALMLLLVIPTLIRQAVELVQVAPQLLGDLRTFLEARFPNLLDDTASLDQTLPGLGDTIRERGVAVLESVLNSALNVFNVVTLIVIVPVVSVYMLNDWDRMVAKIDSLVPLDHLAVVRRLVSEIDATLAGFLRGQGLVCLIQGLFYSIALMLTGLNFGLVVGAFAGLISFIPFVGAVVGGILAIGLALFQFWGDPIMIALVAVIFFVGQFVEGNILTPKLVGGSIGLHPVWLLFSLSIFGSLFGFVGLLVAVPVAAMIGVFVRFLVAEYRSGRLYLGLKALEQDGAGSEDPDCDPTTDDTAPARSNPKDTAAR